ncbi:hypothetical protein CEXT_705281, partial [Caerostris extrusa]
VASHSSRHSYLTKEENFYRVQHILCFNVLSVASHSLRYSY